jgi:hypothetical protein
MSKETKFGYGFLLAGAGVPYLIAYLLGETTAAFFVALLLSLLGGWLLFSGHTHERPDLRKRKIVVAICLVVVGVGGSGWRLYVHTQSKEPKEPQIMIQVVPAGASIFADCGITSLPIIIEPQSSIYLLALNEKRMREVNNWGLYEIPNQLNKAVQWPAKTTIRQHLAVPLKEKLLAGDFIYKCDFSNHGQVNVLNVFVELKIWFDNEGEQKAVKFTPVLSPIDAGKHFVFYVLNDCPIDASLAMPDTVGVMVAGDNTRQQIALNRPLRNPIEPLMQFLPTNKQWVREAPCQ